MSEQQSSGCSGCSACDQLGQVPTSEHLAGVARFDARQQAATNAESLEAENERLRELVAALEGERDEWHDKAVVVASAVESESRPLPSGVRIVASQVMAFHRAALAEQAGGVR